MIYIIDYGLNNLFELLRDDYGTLEVKIDNDEFTLTKDKSFTISKIPEKIFKKTILQRRIGHYDYNGQILSIEERSVIWSDLRKNGFWDGEDEDIWVFDTREDKTKFEEFERNCKPLFLEPEIIWDEVEFRVIKKQWIEEKYRPFIVSQIVISNNPANVKAICEYSPSFEQMFKKYAIELGFIEVEDKSFTDNTKGKKFSFHSGIRFSKCNGEYVTKFFENRYLFVPKKGTYEECIASFERDFNAIANYLNLQLASIENKQMEPLAIKKCYDLVQNIESVAGKVDSMKSTRSEYNSLFKLITNLKTLLLEASK